MKSAAIPDSGEAGILKREHSHAMNETFCSFGDNDAEVFWAMLPSLSLLIIMLQVYACYTLSKSSQIFDIIQSLEYTICHHIVNTALMKTDMDFS